MLAEVLLQPVLATGLAGPNRLFEPDPFGGQVVARHNWMIEVIDYRMAINEFARAAQVIKASAKVGVGADAPAEVTFVEAVHGLHIFTPKSHVASNNSALFFVAQNQGYGQPNAFGRARDSARYHPTPDPAHARFEAWHILLLNKTTSPLHPEARLGETLVIGKKPR